MNKIEEAKRILKESGYFVDNLWTIRDVQDKFECSNEQAQDILNKSLTNEATMEQIQYSIKEFAELKGLKEK